MEMIETPAFLFHFSIGSEEAVLEHRKFVEKAHKHLTKSWLPASLKKIRVYFVRNRDELRRFWGNGAMPDWVNSFVALRSILIVNSERHIPRERHDEYISAMMHELTHILLGQINCNIPVWLEEGLCEYFGRRYDHEVFKKKVSRTKIYTFRELEAFVETNFMEVDDSLISENICYKQAQSFVRYLTKLKGEQYLLECIKSTSPEKDFRTQFGEWYGESLDVAEKNWLRTLGDSAGYAFYKRIVPSRHLQVISKNGKALFFNSVSGHNLVCNTDRADLPRLFEFMRDGKAYTEIHDAFSVKDIDGVLSHLYRNKLILYENGSQTHDDLISPNSERIKSGALINNLRLNLTRNCNMTCTYCYVANKEHDTAPMDWETAGKAIEKFFQLQRKHGQETATIRFFGGEPLLNWKVLRQALHYIDEIRGDILVSYLLNTNGTLLRQEMAKELAWYQVDVIISLDGTQESHDKFRRFKKGGGSFDRTERAIDLCLMNHCRVTIDTTLGDHNNDNLKDLIDYLAAKAEKFGNPITLALQPMTMGYQDEHDTARLNQKVEKLVGAFRYASDSGLKPRGLVSFPYSRIFGRVPIGKYCNAAGKELSVNPDGNIYPCGALETKLGTIDDMKSIFQKEPYLSLTRRGIGTIPSCKGCEIEVFCAGGCIADAAGDSNDLFKPTKNCRFEKAFFRAMVKEFIL
jgi:uncharacterized protein